MKAVLRLASNAGERRASIARGLAALASEGLLAVRVSPVVESPVRLPFGAPSAWNTPWLTVVAVADAAGTAAETIAAARRVRDTLDPGRGPAGSPRGLEVDVILWGDEIARADGVEPPSPGIAERTSSDAATLAALAHLDPDLRIAGLAEHTVLERARAARPRVPLWMGIVNATPDSFSDGGTHSDAAAAATHVEAMVAAGVHLIDVGGESTRPGAEPVAPDLEWSRVAPVLEPLVDARRADPLHPRVGIDTRHAVVAARALELGVDVINDVSGLADPAMVELAASGEADWVAMHHLGLPVRADVRFADDSDVVGEVDRWFEARLRAWSAAGLDTRRILLDPGIGFGKTGVQSLELLRAVQRFARHGLRILVGHSRKSFMRGFAGRSAADRDVETIGASLALCEHGVDVLRVHDVPGHVRAYRAWAHVRA